MRRICLFPAASFMLAALISVPLFAQAPDPLLCSTQGDPVALPPINLVDGYCIAPTTSIGSLGGVATITGEGTFPGQREWSIGCVSYLGAGPG